MKIFPISNVYKKSPCFKQTEANVCHKPRDVMVYESDINGQLGKILEFDNEINALKLRISQMRKIKKAPSEIESLKTLTKSLIASKSATIASLKRKTSILYDTTKSRDYIERFLKEHPEIIPLNSLKGAHNEVYDSIWRNKDFFIVDRTPHGAYLDTSFEPNRENYERMMSKGVMTSEEVHNQYGIESKTIKKYLEDGILHFLTLKNTLTGEETPTNFLDMVGDELNAKALERYRKLHTPTKLYPNHNGLISVNALSELGYGSLENLINLIEERKLLGEIFFDKQSGISKKKAKVFYNDHKTKMTLKSLKTDNPDVVNPESLSKITKTSVADIETEILDGRLNAIPFILYPEENSKILLNLKQPKNAEFLLKKRFEQAVLSSKTPFGSVAVNLIYELCPITRTIGNSTANDNPEISTILEKPDTKKLSVAELKKLKSCRDILWQKAGNEEYENALHRVKIACQEYKNGGIESISDNEIKELLKNYKSKKHSIEN